MSLSYLKKKFKNEKVLITGHTGFKGTYLTIFLNYLGSKIIGISDKKHQNFIDLKLEKKINHQILNLSNKKKLEKNLQKFKPKYIFHLAAQSLVFRAYNNPILTWNSNLVGTINLLNCAKKIKSVKYVVIITTDKVYKNDEKFKFKKETDYLMGDNSYSMSKVGIENYVKFYAKENKKIKIITIRAGNVIGGGDWSEKRLVPDIARSLIKKKKFKFRSNKAVRPWIHVLDCIHSYLFIASKMSRSKISSGSAWNVSNSKKKIYRTSKIVNFFKQKFKFQVLITNSTFKEKKVLILNSDKIKTKLNWQPLYNFEKSVNLTMEWYHNYIFQKKNFTKKHIEKYLNERF